jgi:hypothetical protein
MWNRDEECEFEAREKVEDGFVGSVRWSGLEGSDDAGRVVGFR